MFPWVFAHCEPIRRHLLRSRDLRMGFPQSDVLPPLEEWDINLEVGSQVYQLLKGFKQLWDETLLSDNTSLLHTGGF